MQYALYLTGSLLAWMLILPHLAETGYEAARWPFRLGLVLACLPWALLTFLAWSLIS